MKKIPNHATKVFEGVVFDVYQWQQEMFDGSFETFEAISRADAAIVIPILEDGQVLTIIDDQPNREPVITFPGGSVDPGETPLEAAKRELMEETGYSSENWELWASYGAGPKIDCQFHYYVARNAKKTEDAMVSSGEKIKLRPVSIDQMLDDLTEGKQVAFSFGAELVQKIAQGKGQEIIDRLVALTP